MGRMNQPRVGLPSGSNLWTYSTSGGTITMRSFPGELPSLPVRVGTGGLHQRLHRSGIDVQRGFVDASSLRKLSRRPECGDVFAGGVTRNEVGEELGDVVPRCPAQHLFGSREIMLFDLGR